MLLSNTYKSKLRYANPFRNTSMLNKGHFANFCPKLVTMATSLEESGKQVWIDTIHTNIFHLVKKIVKIGLVGPEIIWLKLKKNMLWKAKYRVSRQVC